MLNKKTLILIFIIFASFIAKSQTAKIYANNTLQSKGGTLSLCQNQNINFIDSSSNSNGTRNWIFKNGTPNNSNAQNIFVSFNTAGTDTVFLISNGTLPDTTFILVNAKQRPLPSFTFTNNVCAGTNVTFTNTSTGAGTLTHNWTFGTGTGTPPNSTLTSPTVVFNPNVGSGTINYTVNLQITSNNGCNNNLSQVINIKQLPEVNFSDSDIFAAPPFTNCLAGPSVLNPNYRLTINNNITSQSHINSYTIKWGIGGAINYPAPVQKISYLYTVLGKFNLNIIANGTNGCTNSKDFIVANQSNPAVGITSNGNTQGCAPLLLPFILGGYTNNSPGTYYIFDPDDGSPLIRLDSIVNDTIWHLFNKTSCGKPGNQFVPKITAFNVCDSTTASVTNVKIWIKPIAKFSISDTVICLNQTITVTDSTTKGAHGNACSNTTIYNWTFEGASPSAASTQGPHTFNYSASGPHKVVLKVNNPCGIDSMVKNICVQPVPVPSFNFSWNNSTQCTPTILSFINTSNTLTSCGNTNYLWSVTPSGGTNFIGGTTSSYTNPQIQFLNAGTFNIRLSITNKCGTVFKDTTVVIKSVPQVQLPSDMNYCDTVTLAFNPTNTSHVPTYNANGGSISSYTWSVSPVGYVFVGGTTASSQYPIIRFTQPGTYKVKVEATNECGSKADSQMVNIWSPVGVPVVRDTFSCGPSSFLLSGIIGTNGTTLRWYNDSTTSTILATGLTYSTTLLSVTRNYFVSSYNAATGCESRRVRFTVLIRPIPGAPTGVKVTRCGPSSVSLSATVGSNANNIKWYTTLVGGTPLYIGNPFVTPVLNATTIYYVSSFDTVYGCESSARFADTVVINPLPLVNAGNDTSFCNLPGTVNLLGTPNGGVWSGAGVNPLGVFTPTSVGIGVYNIVYTYTNLVTSCLNRDTVKVSVVGATLPNAGSDTSVCKSNNTITFQGTPSGGTWGGTASITSSGIFTPASVGVYTLIYATGSGSCLARDTILVTVKSLPQPDFIIANGVCPNQNITVSAANGNATSIINYRWFISATKLFPTNIIGNSTLPITTISFPENQTTDTVLYRVKLVLTNADGCIDSVTKNVVLNKRPNTQFTASGSGCGPSIVSVLNSSTNNPNSWNWSSSPSTGVSFNPSATVNTPTILFPANTTSSTINYKLYLTATVNGIGANCFDVDSFTIPIYPKPFVSFSNTIDSGCTPLTLSLDNKSDPKNGEIQSSMPFIWRINNQFLSSDSVPSDLLILNNLQKDSIINIKLIGTTTHGCSDSLGKTITVFPNAKANFSFISSSSCAPFVIGSSNVTVNSYPLANSSYAWQYINPSTKAILNSSVGTTPPGYTLSNPNDSVLLRLVAFSLKGCKSDTIEQLFKTISNPVANFVTSDSVGCSDLNVQFTNTSSTGVANFWSLSTGYTSTNRDINRLFVNTSNVTDLVVQVKLVITAGGSGCKDSTIKFVRVLPKPSSRINLPSNQLCAQQSYPISAISLSKNPSTYSWSIIGNQSATLSNVTSGLNTLSLPDNKSNADSLITISLRTTSVDGCFHDTTVQITWLRRPNSIFTMVPNSCGPSNIAPVNLTNNFPLNQLSWNWSVSPAGTNVTVPSSFQPNIFFPENNTNDSINYSVKLVATSNFGCIDTTLRMVTIYPRPQANFTSLPTSGCTPLIVTFDNKSNARNNEPYNSMFYKWLLNGQLISTDTVINDITFYNQSTQDSIIYITQIAATKHGCRDTITKSITLYPNPKALFNSNNYTSCAPFIVGASNINLSQYPNANTTYIWNVLSGNGTVLRKTQTGLVPPIDTIANPSDSILYRLIVSNSRGCKVDTFERVYRTIANPVASFSINDSIGCSGSNFTFTNQSSSGVSLNWYFSNGVQSSSTNPVTQLISSTNLLDTLHWAKLVITAGGTGCKDSVLKVIRILPKPRSIISNTTSLFCSGQTVNLSAASIAKQPALYSWSKLGMPTVSLIDTNTLNVKLNLPNNQGVSDSTFSLFLRTTSVDGCFADTSLIITVLRRPLSLFNLPNFFCNTGSFIPSNLTTNIVSSQLNWNWSVAPNAISITNSSDKEPNIILPINNSPDSVIYQVKVITERILGGCRDTALKPVVIYPNPIALFTTSIDTSCTPMQVSFDNKSVARNGETQSTMSFQWFINGLMVSQDSVLADCTFSNNTQKDSVITVKLIISSKHGCIDSIAKNLVVHPNARALFNSSRILSCAPFVIDTNIITTQVYANANLSYSWYVNSNYVSSTANFPGFVLTKPDDSVSIRLIVTSKYGCLGDTMGMLFRTIPNPVPNFNPSDTIGCMPLSIQMQNTSTPINGLNYFWKIGSDTSSLKNPLFTLKNHGVLDTIIVARLIVITGNTGCKDSIDKVIRVKPLPRPNFNFSINYNCYPTPISVSNTSLNTPLIRNGSYKWKANGLGLVILNDTASGLTQISYPDNQSGISRNADVSLTVISDYGCKDSMVKSTIIPTRPIANFVTNRSHTCEYDTLGLTNTSSFANNFKWITYQPYLTILNDSSSNTIVKGNNFSSNVDSIYNIKLVVSNSFGCSDSISKQIRITPKPSANILLDKNAGCAPLIVKFKQTTSSKLGSTHKWMLENNYTTIADSIQHTFNGSIWADTIYLVKMISTTIDGCSDTTETLITAKAGAVANLSVTDSVYCMNQRVGSVFISNSSYGSADTFHFDFGDTTSLITLADSSFVHKYYTEGEYLIKLIATNACRTTLDSVKFKVLDKPTPYFNLSDTLGCSPLKVHIANNTNSYQSKYLWNFGNGITSSLKQPDSVVFYQSKLFDTTYIIKLTAFNFCGIDSLQDTIRVLPIPVANFIMSTDSGCSPLPVSFLNTTTGLPSFVRWDFGNGDTSRRYHPYPETYRTEDSTRIYSIKLVASNMCGADSIIKKVKVEPNSVRAFFTTSGTTGCAPFTVNFKDMSIGGNYVGWSFGNGQTSTQNNPIITYQNSGVYTAYLYVNNGCSYDTAKVIINVLKVPQFTISKSSSISCMREPITFQSQLQDSGSIVWYLTPIDSFEQRDVTFSYETAGLKPVLVRMKSATNFCSSKMFDTITVNPTPIVKVNIDAQNQCVYNEFNLNNIGSTQSNVYYRWILSDSNSYIGNTVKHLFSNSGNYQIKLVGVNTFGCKDSASVSVNAYPKPKAKFDYSPKDTCVGPVNVKFYNQSQNAVGYFWSFGNNLTSQQTHPSTVYSNVGNYLITLVASNEFNCFDTTNSVYHVYNLPKSDFNFSANNGCEPLEIQFQNNSTYGTSWYWDFGDGKYSNQENPIHTYLKSGIYDVRLTVIEGGMCSDSITMSKLIEVHQKPSANFTAYLDSTVRPYSVIVLNNLSLSTVKYLWIFDDNTTSTEENPSHKFAIWGDHNIRLVVYSDKNCADTLEMQVYIPEYKKGLFVPNAFTPDFGQPEVRVFKPVGVELKSYHIQVLDKWGELMWESDKIDEYGSPTEWWDGRDKNGVPCLQGSYVWIIKAQHTDGVDWEGMVYPTGSKKPVTSGNVTLIR